MARSIILKVRRFNSDRKEPYFDEFTYEYTEKSTILEALQSIKNSSDSSLQFRHSCHHASCGTCGMRANGKEILACITKISDFSAKLIKIEPLANLPLMVDLVVNMDYFYSKYNLPELSYIRRVNENTSEQISEAIPEFTRFENCIECGLCVSACPIVGSDSSYLGPASLAAAWRIIEKKMDGKKVKTIELVDNEHGCWRCHVAYECSCVCPAGVDPAGAIMALRRTILADRVKKFRIFNLFRRRI